MSISHNHKVTLVFLAAAAGIILVAVVSLTPRHIQVEKTTVSASIPDALIGPAPEQSPSLANNALAKPGVQECAGKQGALGTSRTIIVDPTTHNRIGLMSYSETLPLMEKEVVLTFDDGPESPNTGKVLDILASECVRATFFVVGRMAKSHPELVRRAVNEGHTVGTHTMSHPLYFRKLAIGRARQEIEGGIEATSAALGDRGKLAPFFRFPGFGRTDSAEEYLASRGLMVWSADFPADDWRKIAPDEVARRALSRLEAKGKGVLLLHDIHARTVEALPIIFEALRANGYRVVHVVPAASELPATPTTADQWRPASRIKTGFLGVARSSE